MYDELGIGRYRDEQIAQDQRMRQVSIGQAVKALVLNGLGLVNRALYLTPQFFADKPTDLLIGAGGRAGRIARTGERERNAYEQLTRQRLACAEDAHQALEAFQAQLELLRLEEAEVVQVEPDEKLSWQVMGLLASDSLVRGSWLWKNRRSSW